MLQNLLLRHHLPDSSLRLGPQGLGASAWHQPHRDMCRQEWCRCTAAVLAADDRDPSGGTSVQGSVRRHGGRRPCFVQPSYQLAGPQTSRPCWLAKPGRWEPLPAPAPGWPVAGGGKHVAGHVSRWKVRARPRQQANTAGPEAGGKRRKKVGSGGWERWGREKIGRLQLTGRQLAVHGALTRAGASAEVVCREQGRACFGHVPLCPCAWLGWGGR